MSHPFQSRFGSHLYDALPEVYRSRDCQDAGEHLAKYLDSFGIVLDSIYATLDQRLKDCFPETCQPWLLPYFAQLLDVALLSPHEEGRRREVADAVRWRQGKGTLETVREIAAAVAGLERVEICEGWRRVARSARVEGEAIPAVTASVRGMVPVDVAGAGAGPATAAQPFAPGSFLDTFRRSVDIRTPDWRQGHYQPKSVLLYAAPPDGFFRSDAVSFTWAEVLGGGDAVSEWVERDVGGTLFRRRKGRRAGSVGISGQIVLKGGGSYRFQGINVDKVTVEAGATLAIEDLAARELLVQAGGEQPVLRARSCLVQAITAAGGSVQLEYCTVMGGVQVETLKASECIFMGPVGKAASGSGLPPSGCLRYSRIEMAQETTGIDLFAQSVTRLRTIFHAERWGEPGCGVLHPACDPAISQGAEDGGEMGAFHEQHLVSGWLAALAKLREYLPVGVAAALIPDAKAGDSLP